MRNFPDIFAKCVCSQGVLCRYCAQLTIAVIALLLGVLIMWKPGKVINAQIAFYRLINWKMEPVSLEKEIRNTRIMGLILIVLAFISVVYIVL